MAKKAEPKNPIVQNGDPVLRMHAGEVPRADIGTKKLNDILAHMEEALEREHDGVAIAAPQIGVPLRIFIVSWRAFVIEEDAKKTPQEKPSPLKNTGQQNMVVINPEIIKLSKKRVKVPEGCLSVRWLYGNTMRHEKAMIRAWGGDGKPFTYGGAGLLAQIFQHETDHLNGILFIDHATEIEELSPEDIAKIQSEAKKNSKR